MSTITSFEELEIWQMARQQANEIFVLYQVEPFNKDWELKNQVNGAGVN